jgi:AraC-like DNA-binding protein
MNHYQKSLVEKHTGYTLMVYVVKRKLQYALYELVNGNKIIQIAMDYGFDTHAGLICCRFRQRYIPSR